MYFVGFGVCGRCFLCGLVCFAGGFVTLGILGVLRCFLQYFG